MFLILRSIYFKATWQVFVHFCQLRLWSGRKMNFVLCRHTSVSELFRVFILCQSVYSHMWKEHFGFCQFLTYNKVTYIQIWPFLSSRCKVQFSEDAAVVSSEDTKDKLSEVSPYLDSVVRRKYEFFWRMISKPLYCLHYFRDLVVHPCSVPFAHISTQPSGFDNIFVMAIHSSFKAGTSHWTW